MFNIINRKMSVPNLILDIAKNFGKITEYLVQDKNNFKVRQSGKKLFESRDVKMDF